MSIKHILVIDDSQTELILMSDMLVANGYKVQTASGADEFFFKLQRQKPDLILMDVVMPGQNGFQLTRTLSRDPLYADIPIILRTSKSQETDRLWGMRQGAKDYVTKPVDPRELLTKIDALR
jgi:twitching motility two-component system response regulator PilH